MNLVIPLSAPPGLIDFVNFFTWLLENNPAGGITQTASSGLKHCRPEVKQQEMTKQAVRAVWA
jgi:hypothetical protein